MVDKKANKLTNSISIADSLNELFRSIGKSLAKKFDDMKSIRLKDHLSYISKNVQNSLFLLLPNSQEISKIILKLDEKKSCGYDFISNKILKVTNDVISP